MKIEMLLLNFLLLFVSVIRADSSVAKLKNCCGDDYRNFTGIKCVASDLSQYLPNLNCDKYVLLAELIDYDFDDDGS